MTGPTPEPLPVRAACEAMGCRFEIVITDPGPEAGGVGFLRAVCEDAIMVIKDWHDRLNAFSQGSIVAQLNAEAARGPVRVSDDVLELLAVCAQVHHQSGGAFDITVGPLMRRWGFRGSANPDDPTPAWGQAHILLDPESGQAAFDQPGIEVDLGGVAKGLALDDAAEILREAGVAGAILHGGTSTAIAIGPADPDDAFNIALGPEPEAPVFPLRDSAISVSAPHGRVSRCDGQEHGHVIDPRSGKPSRAAKTAVAHGSNAMLCDAWSTALLVMGQVPRENSGTGSLPSDMTGMLCSREGEWAFVGPASDLIRDRRISSE